MQTTISCTYKESYLPTPRHRKLRWRDVTEDFIIEIRDVTTSEAPIAFVVTGNGFNVDEEGNSRASVETYYAFADELWTPARHSDYVNGGQGELPWDVLLRHISRRASCYPVPELEELQQRLVDICSEFIVRDSVICRRVGEPMYVVMTFGLGHNHGGTSLMLSNHYNSNISHKAYYTALQREEAIEAAKSTALRRGDTDSVASIGKYYNIEVLMPEMVRRNPAVDHGDGDEFQNMLYTITEAAPDATTAGLMVMAATLKGARER